MSSLIDANLGFLACGSRNRQEVESCEKRKRLKIQERGLKFWFWRPIWDQYDRDESENSSDQIFETETRRFPPHFYAISRPRRLSGSPSEMNWPSCMWHTFLFFSERINFWWRERKGRNRCFRLDKKEKDRRHRWQQQSSHFKLGGRKWRQQYSEVEGQKT